MEEWIQSVAGVLDQGWNDQYAFYLSPILRLRILNKIPTPLPPRAAAQKPPRHYEFPTGFNTYFGPERFQVGELFFAHSRDLVVRLFFGPFLSQQLTTRAA